jgi:homoserine kinase type II
VAVLTSVSDAEAQTLAARFDLGALASIEGLAAGSVNSNYRVEASRGTFFLRLYEEQSVDGARRDVELVKYLSQVGVATPTPLLTSSGEALTTVAGKPAAMFPWIAGTMRCQASVTLREARAVGRALARIHNAGAQAPHGVIGEGRFRPEDMFLRIDRIERANDARFVSEVPGLRKSLELAVAARDGGVPFGLTHGDLFRDNVLWNDQNEIAALLDFESASRGPFVFDLMATILAWCMGNTLDETLASELVRGYTDVRPLSDRERAAMLTEGSLAALRFTITRITDFALRTGAVGPAIVKDWKRFWFRYLSLQALGQEKIAAWGI